MSTSTGSADTPSTSASSSSGSSIPDPKAPIKMLGDRVLVAQPAAEGERRSSKGILIPATAEVAKRLSWAEVVGTGPNVRAVQSGDQVLFNADDRFEVEVHGTAYYILRERDLAAIASPRVEEGGTGLYL